MTTERAFASMSGTLVPLGDARIHVLTPAVKYASAVFEGLRGYWSAGLDELFLFRAEDHFIRLVESMKVMRFDSEVGVEDLMRWTLETVRANAHREAIHLRVLAYVDGQGKQGAEGPIGFAVTSGAAPQSPQFTVGIKLGVSSWVRLSDRVMPPRIKCVANYNNGRLAIMEARQNGYDNALFLTAGGKISETPGSCFFMIRKGRLITPDPGSDILESITRDTVLSIARGRDDLIVEERPVDRSEIYLADEAFVCGTRQEILPVIAIDGLPIGNGGRGALTREIQDRFMAIVSGQADGVPEAWLMPVYGAGD